VTSLEPHSSIPLVVFKLGGSLFDLPNLAGVLRSAIEQRSDQGSVLVVGGGATADVVRAWDQTFGLSPEDAHWLAIEAMRLNESLILRLLPEARVARSARQVSAAVVDRRPAIICADCFVRWGEAAGLAPLPRSWTVTSDSIAAWTARTLGAGELVLMKSVPLPADLKTEEAASAGLVDDWFPETADPIPRLSWLNARDNAPRIETWRPVPS